MSNATNEFIAIKGLRVKRSPYYGGFTYGTVTQGPHLIENTGEWMAFISNEEDGGGVHVKAGSEAALKGLLLSMRA